MKKNNIVSLFALLALLTACDDDYVDQFDLDSAVTDVKSITMTLGSSDYTVIAGNSTNQGIALAKDPEGGTGVTALNAVGTNKYFTADASADDYLPAFLNDKYPTADANSTFTVTYNQYQAPSTYLSDFESISIYELTSSDYSTVWGDNVSALFLSPNSLGQIPTLLASNITDAEEGDMVVVNYAYSEVEPSTGGSSSSSSEPTWTELSVPVRSEGSNWNFVNMGPIDLSDYVGETVNVAFKYTSTSSAAATWELMNFKALSSPYLDVILFAEQEDGTFQKVVKSNGFSGAGNYIIASVGADGNHYPFGRLSGDSYTYGYMYPDAITVTDGVITADDAAYYVITMAETSAGYTLMNALGKYIYQSGSYNSFNVSTEVGDSGYDWTVTNTGGSDLFTITNVAVDKSIKLTYYNGSYSYGSYSSSYVDNYVYTSNSLLGDEGDFTIYDVDISGLTYVWTNTSNYGWKASAYANSTYYVTESYLVSPSIEISESATLPYITIDEAFRYGSTDNLTVCVSTDFDASAAATRAALTRVSSATANASALYRYDGSAWSAYTCDDAEVTVVDPSVYTSLGTTYIVAPENILPAYLSLKYPYASVDDRVAVVYNESENTPTVVEYTKDATGWIETPISVEQTTTFSKDADGNITSNISIYLDNSLLGDDGGFVAEDVTLTGGVTYVWTNTTSYGWKASSYYISTNNQAESWLVSPALDFSKGTAPILTYDEVINYLSDTSLIESYCAVKISTNYTSSVTTATWDQLTLDQRGDGSSYTYYNVGNIDLSAYVGNTVRIAFVYTVPANSSYGPTWEFKNILVEEASEIE